MLKEFVFTRVWITRSTDVPSINKTYGYVENSSTVRDRKL